MRPARVKLQSFALAGGLAGLGGALLAGAFANIAFTENFFLVNDSLNLVAMVVIGGMGSVSGAVIGATFVIGIPAIAPNNQLLGLLSSSLGLLVVLLYFPRGLNQITYGVRDAILSWADRRVGEKKAAERPAYPATVRKRAAEVVPLAGPALAVADLSVHFGGIAAVDKATLSVGVGRDRGPHRRQRGRQVDADERHRGLRAAPRAPCRSWAKRWPGRSPGYRASLGAGPDVPGRDLVSRADGQRDPARGARGEGNGRRCSRPRSGCPGRGATAGPRWPRCRSWSISLVSSATATTT